MPRKAVKPEPEKELTQTEIENQELGLSAISMEDKAKTTLAPDIIRILKKIAYYTAKVGMSLEESCLLVDIEYVKFQEMMATEPLIAKVIKMKELEYKKDLMHTLSQQARGGDDKMAQWLLAKKYPEEFGEKKSPGGEGTGDLFLEALQFIRKNGDVRPMVLPEGGRPIVVRPADFVERPVEERIDDILSKTP